MKRIISAALITWFSFSMTIQFDQQNPGSVSVNSGFQEAQAFLGGGLGGILGALFGSGGLNSVVGNSSGLPVVTGGILPGKSLGDPQVAVRDRVIPRLTNFIYVVLLSLGVGVIIIAGIIYIISAGNSEQTDQARDTIIWAVMGIIAATISYGAVRVLISLSILN